MDIPELAELIWLFECEPETDDPDFRWPDGLYSFRLRRDDREVLFSLDPFCGEAYLTLYVGGEEIASLYRLRTVERLTVDKRDWREGMKLTFANDEPGPIVLQTRPVIRLTWDVLRSDC